MTDNDDVSLLDSKVNRRQVLRNTGVAGAAAGLAGCSEDLRDILSTPTTTLGTETPEPVAGGGVSAARGSDVDRARQQLFFAEAGTGSIVRYDIVRSVRGTVSSGTDVIQGTYTYDFDAGRGGEPGAEAPDGTDDVWWEIVDREGTRYLVPRNGARIALVGDANFADVEPETLASYDYGTERISGSDGDNDLTAGTVFAVRTNQGNYAKVEVTSHGYDLSVRYETYELSAPFTRVGTGYSEPGDVVLVADGEAAYVTDRTTSGGELLKVAVADADRSRATVVAGGLPTPGQLAVDERSNVGYVAAGSDLVRVDLGSGDTSTVYSGLDAARGVAVDAAGEFVYVTEEGSTAGTGVLSRIETGLGRREELATGLERPSHLAWASDTEDSLLFTERAPANRVSVVELPEGTVRRVVVDAPHNPASVSLASPSLGFICSDQLISQFDLAGGLFDSAGPRFAGIGHIPVGYISQSSSVPTAQAGYATTPADFPHHVTDAPFGGTLSLMLDHHNAYTDDGARYYRVFVDGNERTRTWSALKWSPRTGRQESVDVPPEGDGFYPVRRPGALWYRPRLGYKLRTGSLANGLHTIRVEFYRSKSPSSRTGAKSVEVRIDNDPPTARLGRILHRLPDGTDETVDACAIVDTNTDEFRFEVTATDAQHHLRHWRLRALWGSGDSDVVAQQGYTDPHGDRKWEGPRNELQPGGGYWKARTRRCAHTFYLKAWSRTTDGYRYRHRDPDHKSVTLLLP